jgi:two-component system response regulator RstA
VLSRDQIYEALFGLEYNGVDRSVDIYISRLRSKLGEDPSRPQLLKTVRGVGYLLGG